MEKENIQDKVLEELHSTLDKLHILIKEWKSTIEDLKKAG